MSVTDDICFSKYCLNTDEVLSSKQNRFLTFISLLDGMCIVQKALLCTGQKGVELLRVCSCWLNALVLLAARGLERLVAAAERLGGRLEIIERQERAHHAHWVEVDLRPVCLIAEQINLCLLFISEREAYALVIQARERL